MNPVRNDKPFSKTLNWLKEHSTTLTVPALLYLYENLIRKIIQHAIVEKKVDLRIDPSRLQLLLPLLNSYVNALSSINKVVIRTLPCIPQKGCHLTKIAVCAANEELLFRLGTQELLLRQLPKKIIRKINPSREHLVDCLAARILRIFLVASLFAIAHTREWNKDETGLSQLFLMGLLTGSATELTGRIEIPFLVHFFCNFAYLATPHAKIQ